MPMVNGVYQTPCKTCSHKDRLASQEPCFSCINTEDLHRANYGDHTYTHYKKEVFENEEHE